MPLSWNEIKDRAFAFSRNWDVCALAKRKLSELPARDAECPFDTSHFMLS